MPFDASKELTSGNRMHVRFTALEGGTAQMQIAYDRQPTEADRTEVNGLLDQICQACGLEEIKPS